MQGVGPDSGSLAAAPPPKVERKVRMTVAAGLLILGLVPAGILTVIASLAICGISGCSGGGFGRATDPDGTLTLLAVAGAAAGLPLLIYGVWCRSLVTVLVSAVVATLVSVGAGLAIGSDFRGCPREVDTATCLSESLGALPVNAHSQVTGDRR